MDECWQYGLAMGEARSLSGEVTGPWVQRPNALWEEDGFRLVQE